MVADKKCAVKQGAAIYGIAFLVALIMTIPSGNPDYLWVVPGVFGSVVCYLQGVFSPSLWRESNNVSTQRGSIH
jgi:hypothetical protein